MEIRNQNSESKPENEHLVFTDEVEIFKPLETEIEHLREELASERAARLRLAAEYENYRRRTKRERARAADEGKRELLERLISLADDLELALANADESSDTVAEGLQIIQRRFSSLLEANGVAGFESERDTFDPERHEAFDVINDSKTEPGKVHTQIRRGYFWNDKLLRPALVVVAQ